MVSKNQALSGRQADLISWKRAGKWNVVHDKIKLTENAK